MRQRSYFSSIALRVNQSLQAVLVSIVVFSGLKRSRQAFDKLLGERAFLLFDLSLVGVAIFGCGTNLVGIKHCVKSEAVLARADDDDVLAIVHGNFCYARVARLFHGFHQKLIGPLASLFGENVIRSIEIDGIDFVEFDELENFHAVRGFRLYFVELFLGEEQVLAFFVLVALLDLRAFYHAVAGWAEQGLFQARVTDFVELVEANSLGSRRRRETNGYRD